MIDPQSYHNLLEYHDRTKHQLYKYAQGPDGLDWANQPNPFRIYEGAPKIELPRSFDLAPRNYHALFQNSELATESFNLQRISWFLFHSLSLSAWKQYGTNSWPLRVNPSSGNLHPTECYLILPQLLQEQESPVIAHYSALEHALEIRRELDLDYWEKLRGSFPEETFFLALTSISWREAWKYGERAWRYCHIDLGHALSAINVAASGLGWHLSLIEGATTAELSQLLGLQDRSFPEREIPDCLLAITRIPPQNSWQCTIPEQTDLDSQHWLGKPNQLSPQQLSWSVIEQIETLCEKKEQIETLNFQNLAPAPLPTIPLSFDLETLVRQRRSAVAFDGESFISRKDFLRMLQRSCQGSNSPLLSCIPWAPQVHLLLYVHRVRDMDPGIYILVRNPQQEEQLKKAFKEETQWEVVRDIPEDMHLYCLSKMDARELAKTVSCHQSIAADGCFAISMISLFEEPIQKFGASLYPRLYWECGALGQLFYLEAEAAQLRGTGIGCFFDDAVHQMLGIEGHAFQDLYHFTMGGPVED
ncbi:MAG: hypothetical protein COB67_13450, partial [SAR324 cluster bacterium]